jgi:UPF0271 protein
VVLLNLDAGETDDESPELWGLVDILNIACGGHAGDDTSMARVIAAARPDQHIGAHPSYPDRAGFGRVAMTIAIDALEAAIAEQCAALVRIAARLGRTVDHVKPHGALYHAATAARAIADAVIRGVLASVAPGRVTVIGPPRGALVDAAAAAGLRYAREGFSDRRMRADGSLVPRTDSDALITDPARAADQARSLADVDTICIHADTPNALAIARAVRSALTARRGG